MKHFECDYTQGFDSKVLQALVDTNMDQCVGYSMDQYCEKARDIIKDLCKNDKAAIHFMVGGTQTNEIVIHSLLHSYQGVLCCDSGHINTHETGAVESLGHKVIVLPGYDGKISVDDVINTCQYYQDDTNQEHTVMPKMIYISQPTELGTMYSLDEIKQLRAAADKYGLYFFMDGARLGYGLAADTSITLADYAKYLDVFYLGMTKCGAGFGEAVVFKDDTVCPHFRSYMKQGGAMLAKGRLLGVQAIALFENNYYKDLCSNAIKYAAQIRQALKNKNIEEYIKNNTNQVFAVVTNEQLALFNQHFVITDWGKTDDSHHAIRIVTSWGSKQEEVDELVEFINNL